MPECSGAAKFGGENLTFEGSDGKVVVESVTVNPGDFGPPAGGEGFSGTITHVHAVIRCPGCGALAKSQPREVTETEAARLAEAKEVFVGLECGVCGYGEEGSDA